MPEKIDGNIRHDRTIGIRNGFRLASLFLPFLLFMAVDYRGKRIKSRSFEVIGHEGKTRTVAQINAGAVHRG